jgi:hypothetical protein
LVFELAGKEMRIGALAPLRQELDPQARTLGRPYVSVLDEGRSVTSSLYQPVNTVALVLIEPS